MRCGVAAFLIFLITRTWADPDLWGHLLFGRDIVQTGHLPSADTFSFTSDKAWINHEWLAEVFMYLAYSRAGSFGLIALKTAVVLTAVGAVLVIFKAAAIESSLHDLLIFLVVAGMFSRTHVLRPQVFSVALFAILLMVQIRADRGSWKSLVAVPLMFAAWVNLHGGWIVGAAAFALWTILNLFSEHQRRHRTWILGIAIASALATLINPYGWRLWMFLGETVRFERVEISDWQPLWKLPALAIAPWIAAAVVAGLAIVRGNHLLNTRSLLIMALCGIASLFVGRLDVFFILSAVMLTAPAIGEGARGAGENRSAGLAFAAVVVGTIGFVWSQPRLGCVIMDASSQPEPEVVQLVKEQGLRGRMLTFFDWGEYALWHLAPAVRVSFDGRRETVYSQRIIDDHIRIYRDDPGAEQIVSSMNPDYVWLPSQSGVLRRLEGHGWNPLFRGPVSTLLAAENAVGSSGPAMVGRTPESRCFPAH